MVDLGISTLELVKVSLREDIGRGDLTSHACLEPDRLKAEIVAKSDGRLSGLSPALLAFEIVDSANKIQPCIADGDSFKSGETIIKIDGFNQTVLTAERVALNFLAHLSGIATLTDRFVQMVSGTKCRIIDTRKTTPGLRMLEKKAVLHGGGHNHRFGLYDMLLIKDNHIASAGSITDAVKCAKEFITTADFRLQFELSADRVEIEVEITNEKQLREAISTGVQRLLLDNQSLESLGDLVRLARSIDPDILLEASGNVSLTNVAQVAGTGVDLISIGALTHSAPASDFSLKVV